MRIPSVLTFALSVLLNLASAQRHGRPSYTYLPAASAQVPVQTVGYNYPIPAANKVPIVQASASAQQQTVQKVSVSSGIVPAAAESVTASIPPQEAARDDDHHPHMAQIQTIDVACGKERMTVRVTFDQPFNGIIYAKGHYNDPNCRFIAPNQNQKMYQFEMMVGQCGVQFIDSGLTSGGKAYVEGLLIIIMEMGVQEAWDAARRIQCLWEGNIDQTVTFPLSINMLESETLTFSGDTAAASLEIQSGRGPRSNTVQGLVRIGDLLTAVVTVQGDADFDLLVRNCVATDGTPNNKIILSDKDCGRLKKGAGCSRVYNPNRGCATKPKLMGGWTKQKNTGNTVAFAYLSAFKFPDIMDLFLECTVSLCKGACEECPEFLDLHVPTHGSTTSIDPPEIEIDQRSGRERRHILQLNSTFTNKPEDSLTLRRVVHVVGPDDLPELAYSSPPIYGNCPTGCFSVLSILVAVALSISCSAIVMGVLRRRSEKF